MLTSFDPIRPNARRQEYKQNMTVTFQHRCEVDATRLYRQAREGSVFAWGWPTRPSRPFCEIISIRLSIRGHFIYGNLLAHRTHKLRLIRLRRRWIILVCRRVILVCWQLAARIAVPEVMRLHRHIPMPVPTAHVLVGRHLAGSDNNPIFSVNHFL